MNDDLVLVQISGYPSTHLDGATVGMTENRLYAVGAEIGYEISVGTDLRYADSDFALFTNLKRAIEYYDAVLFPEMKHKYPGRAY